MNRIVGVIAAGVCLHLCGGAGSAMAQEGELNKQVEVNKEYVPDVGKAVKLGIVPRMTDTVSLRPEIGYSIRPSVWHTGFGVPAINPVRLSTAAYRPSAPFFLKAGVGYPLQSLLDFYGHWDSRQGGGGVYVNHYGQYADIEGDAGRKEPATGTSNRVGAYGMHAWGRTAVRGEVGYDYRLVSRYGIMPQLAADAPAEGVNTRFPDVTRQHYSTPRARVELGNDFRDLSRLNFRIGLEGYYMTDRYDYEETGLQAVAELGRKFGVHTFMLKGGFDGYWGNDKLDYTDRIASAGIRYGIDLERFKFMLGVDYVYDGGTQDNWFFPDFRITFDVTSGYFVPFVEVDGRLQNNGYRSTSLQNPFAAAGLVMPNTAEYNGRAGITGSFSSSFSYKAYAGVTFFRKLNFFAYLPDATFGYLTDNATRFTVGAELDGRVSGSFSLEAAAHYYGYTLKNLDKAGDRPDFDVSLNLRYDYRDKFTIRAGAELSGRRYCYEMPYLKEAATVWDYETVRLSPVVDVNLEAQLKVSRMVRVFLAGYNLACSKLYLFDHYRSMGINVMAGAVLSF